MTQQHPKISTPFGNTEHVYIKRFAFQIIAPCLLMLIKPPHTYAMQRRRVAQVHHPRVNPHPSAKIYTNTDGG